VRRDEGIIKCGFWNDILNLRGDCVASKCYAGEVVLCSQEWGLSALTGLNARYFSVECFPRL